VAGAKLNDMLPCRLQLFHKFRIGNGRHNESCWYGDVLISAQRFTHIFTLLHGKFFMRLSVGKWKSKDAGQHKKILSVIASFSTETSLQNSLVLLP
jgi:hypothetical protein